MASTPNGKSKTFLDIPTPKGLKTAFVVIVVFMVLAGGLYCLAGRKPNDDVAKVADTLIQGAIISILFAFLKAMIDKRPWWRVVMPWGGTYSQQQLAPAAPSRPSAPSAPSPRKDTA